MGETNGNGLSVPEIELIIKVRNVFFAGAQLLYNCGLFVRLN